MISGFLNGLAQQATPVAYLEAISLEQERVATEMMQYISAANHGKSARKVEKRRNELLVQVKESERNVRKLKPFAGNSKLRDSIAHCLKVYHLILTEDYGKIVDLEDIAEQSYDAMEAYLMAKERAGDHMETVGEAASREFSLFAAENNVKLVGGSSKLGRKLKEAGEVNRYQHQVYLLFFKSYRNEKSMIEAFEKKDLNAVEQFRNALLTSVSEDQMKLGKVPPFQGDASIKTACQQLFGFYKSEAAEKVPQQLDFALAMENFEKIKKAYDSKRPNDRTQEDVNSYNNAVKEINAKIGKNNQALKELNERRSALLKSWNDSVNNFLDKYTPR